MRNAMKNVETRGLMPLTEVMSATPESSWETMLKKLPSDVKIVAAVLAFLPYSLAKICGRVLTPLSYKGLEKKTISAKQPTPPPRVNHQAENP
jgi:hypothetical protein